VQNEATGRYAAIVMARSSAIGAHRSDGLIGQWTEAVAEWSLGVRVGAARMAPPAAISSVSPVGYIREEVLNLTNASGRQHLQR
jgi:hypothetical protein